MFLFRLLNRGDLDVERSKSLESRRRTDDSSTPLALVFSITGIPGKQLPMITVPLATRRPTSGLSSCPAAATFDRLPSLHRGHHCWLSRLY